VDFEAGYNKIELQNIIMTSFQKCHHRYVTEKCHQNNGTIFFQFGSLPIKISGYASETDIITSYLKPILLSNYYFRFFDSAFIEYKREETLLVLFFLIKEN